jgi:enterochelin esterase-like enzyme
VSTPSPLASAALDAIGPFHHFGRTVLVFQGPAQEVRLRTWMPRFPEPDPFTRIEGSDRWYLPLRLPGTARIEYRLGIKHRGRWHEVIDPTNPADATNPFGTNSVVTGPDYQLPEFLKHLSPAAGELQEIRVTSRLLGGRRHHHLYLPPGFRRGTALPLLIVHDGSDFLHHASILSAIDFEVTSGTMAPIAALLVDPWDRLAEYAASRDHAAHLVDEVLPHIQRRLGLVSLPDQRALMGASMGAVASLATAWHFPRAFGRIGLISGSFVDTLNDEWPAEIFAPVTNFLDAFAREPRLHDYRAFTSVGRYEGLVDFHRRLSPLLRAARLRVHSVETWDGHHWGAWRDRLGDCLRFLFPDALPTGDRLRLAPTVGAYG